MGARLVALSPAREVRIRCQLTTYCKEDGVYCLVHLLLYATHYGPNGPRIAFRMIMTETVAITIIMSISTGFNLMPGSSWLKIVALGKRGLVALLEGTKLNLREDIHRQGFSANTKNHHFEINWLAQNGKCRL